MADHPKRYKIVDPPWPMGVDPRPGLDQIARGFSRLARAGRSVRPIDPAELRRIFDPCPACERLGHICRPCRRARYEARYPSPVPLLPPALIVLAFFAVGAAVLAIAAWRGLFGRG